MLKLQDVDIAVRNAEQPPSGGCVLKLISDNFLTQGMSQPPSGGCVLKRPACTVADKLQAAAFRRLCVET